MKVSIIQSCYIPWIGFFDLIGRCDEYVIFDSTQYARRHWHNRNKVKMTGGADWLTIPVLTKGEFDQSIEEVMIEKPWSDKHWRSIEMAYAKTLYFQALAPLIRDMYSRAALESRLTDVNEIFLTSIAELLGLKTRITRDSAYPKIGKKTERLLGIAKAVDATSYLSGPSARDYFEETLFKEHGIAVEWMDYSGYPEYPQLHGAFDQGVSILDPIFNIGIERTSEILAFRRSYQCVT